MNSVDDFRPLEGASESHGCQPTTTSPVLRGLGAQVEAPPAHPVRWCARHGQRRPPQNFLKRAIFKAKIVEVVRTSALDDADAAVDSGSLPTSAEETSGEDKESPASAGLDDEPRAPRQDPVEECSNTSMGETNIEFSRPEKPALVDAEAVVPKPARQSSWDNPDLPGKLPEFGSGHQIGQPPDAGHQPSEEPPTKEHPCNIHKDHAIDAEASDRDKKTLNMQASTEINKVTSTYQPGNVNGMVATLRAKQMFLKQSQKQKEKAQKNMWQRRMLMLVENARFNIVATCIVVLHSVFIAFDTDWDLGVGAGSMSFWFDLIFTVAYTAEAVIRNQAIGNHRLYFGDRWNILDVTLIVLSVGELLAVCFFGADDRLSVGVVVLRLLRLLRLARLFRFFKQLWLLARGIATSMQTVLWAWLLIGLQIYIFGLFFARWFAPYAKDDPDIMEYFGTVDRSMFSMFQVVTLEDWFVLADAAYKYYHWTRIVFILVLVICPWGIMHVVVAIFVESAVDNSCVRSKDLAKRANKEYLDNCQKICDVFREADTNGDGILSKDEFLEALTKPTVIQQFKSLGIDSNSAETLFDILDLDMSGSLDGEEFVEGIVRSRGLAQNKDVIALRCDVWRVQLSVEGIMEDATGYIEDRIQSMVGRLKLAQEECAPLIANLELLAGQQDDMLSTEMRMITEM